MTAAPQPRSDRTNDLIDDLLAEDLAPPSDPDLLPLHLNPPREQGLRMHAARRAKRRRAAGEQGGWRFALWRTRNRNLIGGSRFEEQG